MIEVGAFSPLARNVSWFPANSTTN